MKILLVALDLGVGEAADHVLDGNGGEFDRLKHLQRVLVQNFERAVDALVGDLEGVAIGKRGGVGEERQRQQQRSRQQDLQHPNRGFLRGLH